MLDQLTDVALSKDILEKIASLMVQIGHPITLMHICGTHEYAIAKSGLRSLLPPELKIISGPGCPVCVCPTGEIDLAVELSQRPEVIITSFGDMMRVPSNTISLFEAKAHGGDVRVVYGPHEAVELARQHPDRELVFFAVGFETTAPLIAYELVADPPPNFSIICAYKRVPPAMEILLNFPDLAIDGFILPGHVCAITGSDPYVPLAEKYQSPMVVAGFEVNDILISLMRLLMQIISHNKKVENTYTRIVLPQGNVTARQYMERAFVIKDTIWRGIGMIPASGYGCAPEFKQFDAVAKFGLTPSNHAEMPKGCSCDQVLIGKLEPHECPLFGRPCTPQNPIGPCMVSHEGHCKIAYTFRNIE